MVWEFILAELESDGNMGIKDEKNMLECIRLLYFVFLLLSQVNLTQRDLMRKGFI